MEATSPNNVAASHLYSHLGYLLRRVSNRVSGRFARKLQEVQTSVAEWAVMRHLFDAPGTSAVEIASVLGMTRGAISKVVDKLERKEWIVARANSKDGRVLNLSLTAAGRRTVPQLARLADENDQFFFNCLEQKETEMLRSLLGKLIACNDIRDIPIE